MIALDKNFIACLYTVFHIKVHVPHLMVCKIKCKIKDASGTGYTCIFISCKFNNAIRNDKLSTNLLTQTTDYVLSLLCHK